VVEARSYQCPVCGAFAREGERSCRHCSTLLATLRCGHCFELSFPSDLHCRGCGLELGLEPVAEPSELSCPDCKLKLKAFQAGNGLLYACERCGAQLVTHGLLRALLESREVLGSAVPSIVDAPRANPLSDPVRYRPCPGCGLLMNRKNFGGTSGVIVDVCSLHGSFFDPGELPRVLAFARRGGLVREKATLEARKRAERPDVPSMLPAAPSSATLLPDLGVVDLLDFVIDLLTARRK
jgi:Zn-finger nucleic acid-binding protein